MARFRKLHPHNNGLQCVFNQPFMLRVSFLSKLQPHSIPVKQESVNPLRVAHKPPNSIYTTFAFSWHSKTTCNTRTAHGTATKPGRSTVLRTPLRSLEDHGCKLPVTKLANALHTCLRMPQPCSLCIKEFHRDCHMISWRDTIVYRLVSRSLHFVATFEHLMSDVFQRKRNGAARDCRILSYVGGTFLKYLLWNNWSVPTQCEQSIVCILGHGKIITN